MKLEYVMFALTKIGSWCDTFDWNTVMRQNLRIMTACDIPAPVMTAPLNEVFPVTSAPSRLALVRLACSCAWKAKLDHDKRDIPIEFGWLTYSMFPVETTST